MKKLLCWVVLGLTLLLLGSCASPCNCGYAQNSSSNSIENVA